MVTWSAHNGVIVRRKPVMSGSLDRWGNGSLSASWLGVFVQAEWSSPSPVRRIRTWWINRDLR